MALSVVLTINSTPYDVADYVMKDSIIIDESLFNDKDLRPTTNKASFILSRDCPYIDELFAWADDVPITISLDGVLAFTGYLTDDHSLSIGTTGAREVKIDAEDPGIRKLKVSWVSTDTLSTIFNGDKVCDPADTGNSFVHILAALAGVNLATMPTISSLVYFTVKDSDSKDYWGILADVLFEHQYVFYFNAAGELALFSLAGLTGTPAQMVSTSADVLAKNGDIGIKVTKRLLTWKQVDVKFKEAETLSGAVIYRDTTGQTAINDCDIPLAGGAYYPSTCDASTYAYIDYFLEDGREILSVGSAASSFVVDSGITAEYLNLGLSARVRFLNTLGITADIRKLKVAGTNVVAVKSQSKVIAGESSKFKKEYEAKYLTDKTKATELANLLYYFYKNSSSTYKWRSYMGTLYPSETLFPAATLYPLGDLIALGEKIDLKDPVFSGLDVDVAVTKRKYRLGYYGADYEGVGIGTITLSSAVGYTPTAPAIVPGPKYLATKPLAADPLGASPDTADFIGQYGVYSGQRYTCTALPDTWALDDAGQTAAQVQAAVAIAPKNLGRYDHAHPATHNPGDWWTVFDTDDDPIQRGIWYDNAGTPTRISAVSGEAGYTTDATLLAKLSSCMADVAWCEANSYGTAANYGISMFFESFGAVTAFITELFAQNILATGSLSMGSGANLFKASSDGIHLGAAAFADAPFKVSMAGVLEAIGAIIRGTAIIDNGLFNGSLNTGAFKSESSSAVATWASAGGSWLGSAFYTAFSSLALGAVVPTTAGDTYGTNNITRIQRITGSMKLYTDDGKVFSILNDSTSYSATGSITTTAGGINHFKNSILVDPDATAGTVTIGTNDARFASVFADGMRADTFYADESFSTAGAFNSYKIDDDTSPIARKTATDGAVLTFTVYKAINVRAVYDGNSSLQLFIRNNGSYNIEYVVVPSSSVYKVFPMMPGNYRITTVAGYTLTLDCIGAYGTTDGSAIWS